MKLEYIAGKTRPQEQPYAVFRAGGWEWRVLKSWQKDDAKPYGRWFCAVSSPYTFGSYDLGDVYVYDILVGADAVLVEIEGREPTDAELDQVEELRALVTKPDINW